MDIDLLILYNIGMPDLIFRIPQINDKRIFDKYLEKSRSQISETTFTNIFMWRNVYNYMYAEHDGLLWIKYQKPGAEESYFVPLGDLTEEAFRAGLDAILGENARRALFSAVTEDQLGFLRSAGKCEVMTDRDNWDYLYNASDLIHLPGKKYDGKRNHIHRFERDHEISVEKITPDNIADCRRIMDAWAAQTAQRNEPGRQGPGSDYAAVIELLENYASLGCRGILVKVDGAYAAFTIGEMMNGNMNGNITGNTAVIHAEKAVRGIPGLYQFINRQFCVTEWQDAVYVNREQDMGIPGLRRSKESYHPVKHVEKYKVWIITS